MLRCMRVSRRAHTNLFVVTRVVLSMGLLVSSKLITIQVPFFFKEIVDQLNVAQQALAADPTATIPLAMLLGYGIARTTAATFQELRNAVFASVAQKAIRKASCSSWTRP